jgi:hypothetical protein
MDWHEGDPAALDRLMHLVYAELRRALVDIVPARNSQRRGGVVETLGEGGTGCRYGEDGRVPS